MGCWYFIIHYSVSTEKYKVEVRVEGEMITLGMWSRAMHYSGDGHEVLWEPEDRPLQGKMPLMCYIRGCSSHLSSFPVPGQHTLRGLELQLLLVNAKSVNNNPLLIQDLIEEE